MERVCAMISVRSSGAKAAAVHQGPVTVAVRKHSRKENQMPRTQCPSIARARVHKIAIIHLLSQWTLLEYEVVWDGIHLTIHYWIC